MFFVAVRKEKLLGDLEKLDQKLSNPKELINFSCQLASKLRAVWASWDYYQKQIFQNTLFPDGLGYDSKTNHYRTPLVNSVIGCIALLSGDFGDIKKPDFSNLLEKSGLVPYGSDLSNLMNGFQSLRELMNATRSHFRL